MAAALEGGCACAAVRYRLAGAPMFVNCCHCTDCQTETGSAFVISALIERDQLELTAGAPEPVLTPSASGRGQEIWRCPDCRIALWSHYGDAGADVAFVRAGTLDDAGALAPDAHIYTRSKLPWIVLPGGTRAFETFYPFAETWPAESLARFVAATAG